MRKLVTLAVFLALGCVPLGLVAANFFPDQTWRALMMAQTRYDGIVSRITPMPSGADRHLQEYGIYESVVREFVGSSQRKRTIFLRVSGADPSDELLAQLRASGLIVRRASEAHLEGLGPSRVWTDRATGGGVEMIDVGSVSWVFGDSVEVSAGVTCGSLCGTGGIYQLVKRHGRWTVAECRSRWVS